MMTVISWSIRVSMFLADYRAVDLLTGCRGHLFIPQRLAVEVVVAPLHVLMVEGGVTGIWTIRTGDRSLDILGLTPSFHHRI